MSSAPASSSLGERIEKVLELLEIISCDAHQGKKRGGWL